MQGRLWRALWERPCITALCVGSQTSCKGLCLCGWIGESLCGLSIWLDWGCVHHFYPYWLPERKNPQKALINLWKNTPKDSWEGRWGGEEDPKGHRHIAMDTQRRVQNAFAARCVRTCAAWRSTRPRWTAPGYSTGCERDLEEVQGGLSVQVLYVVGVWIRKEVESKISQFITISLLSVDGKVFFSIVARRLKTSEWHKLEKGIITGCTISVILFALAMNMLVKSAEVQCREPSWMTWLWQQHLSQCGQTDS